MTETPDAAAVRRMLHWAWFTLGASLLILVIDLQLKKSIGRLAVQAAKAAETAVGHARGPAGTTGPAHPASGVPDGDSSHGVARATGNPADDADPDRKDPGPAHPARRRTPPRTRGNG